MKYLGIDYGTKRIGLAVSDSEGKVAFPFMVITAGPTALSEIDALVKSEGIEKIVVGESRNLSGAANLVMEGIDEFAKDLGELTNLSVEYEQEFFTSSLAARQFAPGASRGANPAHKDLDASAAALILQSYLDRTKNTG